MSQSLQDIAVFFNEGDDGLRVLDLAAHLASRQQALLIGICVAGGEQGHHRDAFARGEALSEVIQRREAANAVRLLHAGKALQNAAKHYDIKAEFRIVPYTESREDVSLHSLYCDLLVVSESLPGLPFLWSGMDILEKTGVPILLIPSSWQGNDPGRRILVGWNGSRQARRAIADAMPLLTAADAVDLLIVDAEQHAPLRDEEPGADMAAYLARHGVKVELLRVQSNDRAAADVILQQAENRGADMIVIGAYSKSRLREAFLGGVTRSLLAELRIPLLISH